MKLRVQRKIIVVTGNNSYQKNVLADFHQKNVHQPYFLFYIGVQSQEKSQFQKKILN